MQPHREIFCREKETLAFGVGKPKCTRGLLSAGNLYKFAEYLVEFSTVLLHGLDFGGAVFCQDRNH
jgi:hypothetical protein